MSELTDIYNGLEDLRKQLTAAADKYGDVETIGEVIPVLSIDSIRQLGKDCEQLAENIAAVQAEWVTHQLLD